jgi:hypothetical protein
MADFRWLIEAPGARYLAPRNVGGYDFHWTQDYNEALAFRDEGQADLTMMAIRQLAPSLFDFERTIGNAKAVEHGWLITPGEMPMTKDQIVVLSGPACASCKQIPKPDCDNPACAFRTTRIHGAVGKSGSTT